jgi:uncharacterized membrane protein YadS
VVKLFRVLLLLAGGAGAGPVVRRARAGDGRGAAPAAVPGFAVGFLVLCALNSALPTAGAVGAVWVPLRAGLVEASSLGLLLAIAALGLGTSVRALLGVGWRRLAVFGGASLALLAFVAGVLAAASLGTGGPAGSQAGAAAFGFG